MIVYFVPIVFSALFITDRGDECRLKYITSLLLEINKFINARLSVLTSAADEQLCKFEIYIIHGARILHCAELFKTHLCCVRIRLCAV